MYTDEQTEFLRRMAAKYIWWKKPDEAMRLPQRVIAQIMNTGLWDDLRELNRVFSPRELLMVLGQAECGWFNARSWHFWHYTLTDAKLGEVPSMPSRFPD